jgi:hypothetical protein
MFSKYLLLVLTISIIATPQHTLTDPDRPSFPEQFSSKNTDRYRQPSDEELSMEATKNSDVYKRHQHDGAKQFWGAVILGSFIYGIYKWIRYGNSNETKNTEAVQEQNSGEKTESGNNASTEGASTGDSTAQ